MNRLGMLIGVSHLSANGVLHVAEITKHPIVSTHQNIQPFLKTPLELLDEEVKAIAGTGGSSESVTSKGKRPTSCWWMSVSIWPRPSAYATSA